MMSVLLCCYKEGILTKNTSMERAFQIAK
ncbi:hypothetical protein S122051_0805 [Staphylococcus aureus subsp. aureus 122051]|nr:hypothetical protein S122051_0805 [Staphylococcus aureus subsp. aureus 122051]EOR49471.1 hypothetical protein M140OLGA_0391 [Staphylococcus aureus subsp. aureus 112808A]